ncbi:MAG: hypothetical protein ACTSYI_08135 [Promethearchaeota archaeon]
MNQKKTHNHISKNKTSKQDGEAPKKKVLLKVNIFSTKEESIKYKFLQAVGALGLFSGSTKQRVGVEYAVSSYIASKDYTIQHWLIENITRFEPSIPDYLLGSSGVIYFYRITDAIEERHLALVKSGIDCVNSKMRVLFVGYDAVLPDLLEEIDQNIPIIQKYFPVCHSIYIAVDVEQPETETESGDALVHVLDELISFDAEF